MLTIVITTALEDTLPDSFTQFQPFAEIGGVIQCKKAFILISRACLLSKYIIVYRKLLTAIKMSPPMSTVVCLATLASMLSMSVAANDYKVTIYEDDVYQDAGAIFRPIESWYMRYFERNIVES